MGVVIKMDVAVDAMISVQKDVAADAVIRKT